MISIFYSRTVTIHSEILGKTVENHPLILSKIELNLTLNTTTDKSKNVSELISNLLKCVMAFQLYYTATRSTCTIIVWSVNMHLKIIGDHHN